MIAFKNIALDENVRTLKIINFRHLMTTKSAISAISVLLLLVIRPKDVANCHHMGFLVATFFDLSEFMTISLPLKTTEDVDSAVNHLTQKIIDAVRTFTHLLDYKSGYDYPANIINKIAEKRKLRRIWHNSRSPEDKRKLNKATRELRKTLQNLRNEAITEGEDIWTVMNSPFKLSQQIKLFTSMEVKETISIHVNPKKALGLD
ncbi:hypothetical protein M0802_011349 [Mischocyttarus mexicanus]|nr:hypothetical protein M0802_011349 [Mischocyttarus mexicanus]